LPARLENIWRKWQLRRATDAPKKISDNLTQVKRLSCSARLFTRCDKCFARSKPMLDLILVATALVFFAVSIGYAYACDRL